MTPIFIDTSAFIAFLREKDADHQQAIELLKRVEQKRFKPITTDYIADETYTGLLKYEGYTVAMEFDLHFTAGLWRIERITEARFTVAQSVFRKYNKDKQWSFTDCTSYVVMKELKISTVFTFDDHFAQMGIQLLS